MSAMMWRLARAAAAAMRAAAERAHPEEACGLLFGGGSRIDYAVTTANVAPDRLHRFEIDPAALFAAQRAARTGGPQLVGYFHSHPNGDPNPSPVDAAAAAADGRIWIVVAGGRLSAWRAGRTGLHGRFAPITLHAD
ncbi:MAG: Mov34/MPN/PAD-1 family protein [Pseudomonadota bacterium]